MKKIKVTETESYGDYELSGELSDIIKWLQEKKEQGWETMEVDLYAGAVDFSMSRLETDKEFEKRKKQMEKKRQQDAKSKELTKKNELELYKKLKQKYETV